jgi:hypothetical protein
MVVVVVLVVDPNQAPVTEMVALLEMLLLLQV